MTPVTRLSEALLPVLSRGITVPAYDRATVTPGIVHLGVGAFHRAHQAVLVDDCLGRGETEWSIIAASLRSPDTRDALRPQDNLYTYCERDGAGETLRVMGSIIETLVAPENPGILIERMSDPRVRIVTLTVTEKGYCANLAARTLLRDHPDIAHDLAHPDAPRSIYGFLLAATRRRLAMDAVPLTLLSCDNLPSNGRVLHALFLEFAQIGAPDLASHITNEVSCPSTMVDRIVPATTDADRQAVAQALGVMDAWPVVAEPYFRWVIEDRFPHGRPALEKSGAEFVEAVEPYEHMKLRMLNGAHSAIAAIGQVAGLGTVADVYAVPVARGFIDRYWREVAPTLGAGLDAGAYVEGLRTRFANPTLRHRTAQIATDASQKVPQRILAPLGELWDAGRPTDAPLTALALWIRSCAKQNEGGEPISMNDPVFRDWDAPDQEALSSEAVAERFLGFGRVFGLEWRARRGFAERLAAALDAIREHGTLGAIARLN